jgi:hypothetical protein
MTVGAVCAASTNPIPVAVYPTRSSANVRATGTTAEPSVEAVVPVKNRMKVR